LLLAVHVVFQYVAGRAGETYSKIEIFHVGFEFDA
jgi:hypothetical protein